MSGFKIKDFNKLVVSGIEPFDSYGNFIEATTNFFRTDEDVYVLNPLTKFLAKWSGFDFWLWNEYDYIWLNSQLPDPIAIHTQNHYRALALVHLIKDGVSVDSLQKILNITTGYPFAFFSGKVSGIEEMDNNYIVTQYIMDSTDTLGYKIPNSYSLCVSSGQDLDFYNPLISGIDYMIWLLVVWMLIKNRTRTGGFQNLIQIT